MTDLATRAGSWRGSPCPAPPGPSPPPWCSGSRSPTHQTPPHSRLGKSEANPQAMGLMLLGFLPLKAHHSWGSATQGLAVCPLYVLAQVFDMQSWRDTYHEVLTCRHKSEELIASAYQKAEAKCLRLGGGGRQGDCLRTGGHPLESSHHTTTRRSIQFYAIRHVEQASSFGAQHLIRLQLK